MGLGILDERNDDDRSCDNKDWARPNGDRTPYCGEEKARDDLGARADAGSPDDVRQRRRSPVEDHPVSYANQGEHCPPDAEHHPAVKLVQKIDDGARGREGEVQ
jgi:hypothetical protein